MKENNSDQKTIEHLIKCYDNVQSVIRFLDTKAAAVFTISGVFLGMIATSDYEWGVSSRYFLALTVIFILGALLFSLRTIKPNHGPKKSEQFSLLFPALDPKAKTAEGNPVDITSLVQQKIDKLRSQSEFTHEFSSQFSHLHKPLVRKISSLRSSINSLVVAIVCFVICLIGKTFERKEEKQLRVATQTQIMDSVTLKLDESTKVSLIETIAPIRSATIRENPKLDLEQ
ncbi:MAG: hypothetical protein ACSHX7_11300 [Luteolibacter sp.]